MSELPVWDAAAKLNTKSYSARNVFTVNWKGGNWKLDFKKAMLRLAPMLGLTQDQASKFIKWALGSGEWDEATGSERYKLGDIYHSGGGDRTPREATLTGITGHLRKPMPAGKAGLRSGQ